MEYYKNLLENDFTKKKGFHLASVFSFIFGVFMIAFAIFYLVEAIRENRIFYYFFSFVFFLNGVVSILRGFNFHIEKLFGKAFVHINDKGITLKLSPLKAEQTVYWEDVESIYYTAGKFSILQKDQKKLNLSVMELSYATIQDIKKSVSEYARLNDVTLE